MSAHTEWPWRIDRDDPLKVRRDLGFYGLDCGELVATANVGIDERGPTADEAKANALLIAAAPKLLAAAKRYAENFLMDEFELRECCVSDEQHAAVRSLFYAIAQAEGC